MVDRRSHKRGAGAGAAAGTTAYDNASASAAAAEGDARRSTRSHAGAADADSADLSSGEGALHANVELRPLKRSRISDDHKHAQTTTETTAVAESEADAPFKEESKEADQSGQEQNGAASAADLATTGAAAAAATPAPPAATPAATVLSSPSRVVPRPTRLASVFRPAFGMSSPSSVVATAAGRQQQQPRSLRLSDRGQTVAIMDLTSPPKPGLISMPPSPSPSAAVSAATGRRLRNARGTDSEIDEPSRTNTRNLRTRNSHADGDRAAEVSEARPAAAASARPSSSRSRGSRSTATPPLVQQSKTARQKRHEMLESQAKELGMTVAELRRVQGIAVDDEDDESDADLKAEGDTKNDAAASDDDEESVRPQRRATRSKRVKDDESEGFEPSVHDDDEAEEEEEVEEQDNDDDDEEEEGYRGRSGRTIRKPVTFAEEQGRELTRRVTRNRRDSSGDERASPNERVQISYERPVHKSEQLRLADGRVVSERELRAMQRHGEQVRVLQEGEEPDAHDAESSGMAQAAAAAAAHPGDVRRSSRPRQQVQHYTVGEKAQHSDDSADDHKPRYPPRQQSGGRARGGANKGRRPGRPRHRRTAFYGDSSSMSSSSSDSSESDQGKKHRRRDHKDRDAIQPLHLQIQHQMRKMENEAAALAGRAVGSLFGGAGAGAGAGASGKSKDGRLADIDPIEVDSSTDWSSIGGLDSHVHALKEMVVLPLLYPELFHNFHLQPPKGVLFFGPPGTGKTLVARALANTCNATGQKVSFFMRKGADCLSKWVGEAERQLRLLFEQAHKMQPSIIFFDEIDGLAPVRSSRQDQIHASIVSTLLALMDGLDNRGQVIVIGATNRPDSIDPALRRPGRFDRELMFSLPNKAARRQILQIHTRNWQPPLQTAFLHSVADLCVGYCGADLKALCTEATLRAVRRKYPQIYMSTEKLAIDVAQIQLKQCDFIDAMRLIVPASQRSAHVFARSIPAHLEPLLQPSLDAIIAMVKHIFPLGALNKSAQANASYIIAAEEEDEEAKLPPEGLAAIQSSPAGAAVDVPPTAFPLHASAAAVSTIAAATGSAAAAASPSPSVLASLPPRPSLPLPLKPRFLLHGESATMGQSHLGPALLHHLEEYPIFSLDLPLLLGDAGAKNAEESCVRIIGECKRNAPAILYWPHLDLWWSTAPESLQNTALMLLADLPPTAPVFLLATADCRHRDLPAPLLSLFPLGASAAAAHTSTSTLAYELERPTAQQLIAFFKPVVDELRRDIPRMRQIAQLERLPVLPKAVEVAPAAAAGTSTPTLTPEQQVAAESSLTPAQLELKLSQETALIRLQRMSLRGITQKLMASFREFKERLNVDDYPDYHEVVAEVIALDDVMRSVNEEESFDSVTKYNLKIDLLVNNTKEYSAHHDAAYKSWVNKACHLQDVALSLVSQIDQRLVQQCEDISKRRAVRKAKRDVAASTATAAAANHHAPNLRTNLRSQSRQQDSSLDTSETAAPAAAASAAPVSAAAASPVAGSISAPKAEPTVASATADPVAAAAAAGSDVVTSMDVDVEADAVKIEPIPADSLATDQTVAASADPAAASSSPTVLAVSLSAISSAPSSAAAAPAPSPSVPDASPRASPQPQLLPPPPPIELDSARLASLPSDIASLMHGCSVEQAEQTAFQLIKIAVEYQMKPNRNQAMDAMIKVARDNKP